VLACPHKTTAHDTQLALTATRRRSAFRAQCTIANIYTTAIDTPTSTTISSSTSGPIVMTSGQSVTVEASPSLPTHTVSISSTSNVSFSSSVGPLRLSGGSDVRLDLGALRGADALRCVSCRLAIYSLLPVCCRLAIYSHFLVSCHLATYSLSLVSCCRASRNIRTLTCVLDDAFLDHALLSSLPLASTTALFRGCVHGNTALMVLSCAFRMCAHALLAKFPSNQLYCVCTDTMGGALFVSNVHGLALV
jgi:hypothetical protein